MVTGATIGLVRLATIKSINNNKGTVSIVFNDGKSDVSSRIHEAPIPAAWTGDRGEFSGGYPKTGATVLASQGQGGTWGILGYAPADSQFRNDYTSSISSGRRNVMRELKPGRHLIQVKNDIRHITDPVEGLISGDPVQYTRLDPVLEMSSSVFNTSLSFTEASRKIEGPVFRDTGSNDNRTLPGYALTSHEYQKSLWEVGLDPKSGTGDAFLRNPSFNESREIVYEFNNSFDFSNDLEEERVYDDELIPSSPDYFPRRESRADALSLSLIEPNQLIESIKGTVVDIYGNLVDLNRSVLPSGSIDSLSFRSNEGNQSDTFRALREQTRKSIAYHFEINARKETSPDLSNLNFLDLFLEQSDYARNRSKFFVDIDKEGQFRMNVPASSEVGNVGLTVRHENYSTLSASDNDTDPREFVTNVDSTDVFLDSFGKGAVTLSSTSDNDLKGYAAPVDRITGEVIKLGTVFHDISDTLQLHNVDGLAVPQYPDSKLNQVPKVSEVFNPNIIVSGDDANAGGRSGTITLDGMLSMSIGANTSDRQSLWLDLAGGVVSNIGRDVRDISYSGRFDGDILLQIGGTTPSDDSRFDDLNNAYRPGALDIRVASGGQMHIFRIDESGMRVYSVGEVDIVSEGHMKLQSRKGNVYIDGKGIYMYANEYGTARKVLRKPGKSID